MVKKKQHKKEKHKPKKSYAGLIFGIVAVVVVLVILFFALKGCKKEEAKPTKPTPTEPTKPTIEPKPKISTKAPNEIRYCEKTTELKEGKIMIALGYKPCSCKVENGDATLTIMNSGYGDLKAMWFKISGDAKSIYMFDNNMVKSKDSRTYEFDMNQLKTELGEPVKDIIALPVNGNDVDSVCLNQRLIVIKKASCLDRCQ